MLKPHTYISLDFETTGLDPEKDEPIQIGIVCFDEQFAVTDTFVSLIRPEKDHKQLSSIVTYLTGFSLDELQKAPPLEEVKQQIAHFFAEPCVLIGQNISFDIAFLEQFMEVELVAQVDTFPLSKAVLHFAPSYALDVTAELLPVTYETPQQEAGYHDALTDSYAAYSVFRYFVERLHELRHDYLVLDYMIQKNEGMLQKIIARTPKKFSFDNKKLFFPPLKKEVKHQTRRVSDEMISLSYPHQSVLDASETSLKELLQKLDFSEKQVILAFQQRAKMMHAANILKQLQITHSTLHDRAVFDADRVNGFLQQDVFSDDELLFVVKYFSQFQQHYSMIDINSPEDYKIFDTLTTTKSSSSKLPVICTHQQLRDYQHKLTDDQQVLFFDHARWHQSFRRRKYRPFDPLHGVYLLEKLVYAAHLFADQNISNLAEQLLNQYTVFIGVLGSETDKFFIGYPDRKLEMEAILHDPRFPKTTKLFLNFKATVEQHMKEIPSDDLIAITSLVDRLEEILGELCLVEKRMYDGDKWWYLFHQVDQYVDWSELLEVAQPGTWYFVKNLTTNKTSDAIKLPAGQPDKLPVRVDTDENHLVGQLKKHRKHIYIVSTAKHVSQKLFAKAIEQGLQKSHTVLAENITGGGGKNCFLAQKSEKPLIIIGGYRFYFQILSKKIALSGLYLYHLYGRMKQQMLKDMQRYADK